MDRFQDLFAGSSSVLHFPDGSSATTVELLESGMVLARRLRGDGLVRNDRVALLMPNSRAYVVSLLGCAIGRFVAVSVNTRYSAIEADDLIARSGAKLVIRGLSFEETRASGGVDEAEPSDRFVVFTTSGTTSKPKMVVHLQQSIARHSYDVAASMGYRADDVVMAVMPFCGTFGLASLTAAIAGDCTVIVEEGFDAAKTAARLREHGVTVLNGSDDMFHRLVESGADLRSVRIGGYARFNTSLDGIADRAEAIGARLVGLYGMSEVQALFAHRDPLLPLPERAIAGGRVASPEAAYRIHDGELWLRGPSLFAGYLAEGGGAIDDDLTARSFSDNWFRTGDLAEADGATTFTYVTRMNDVLRLGGFLVAPADIEHVLLQYPGVVAAHVVAVDRPSGARPVAFVITDAPIDEAAAIGHCATRLARYKVPVAVLRVDEFPTTPSANGTKIQSVKLRAIALDHLEATR